jgi:hypothetical protein
LTLQEVDPGQAQEAARRILSERRFRPPDVPRPFRGVMETLGRWLRRAWDAFLDALDALLPGPDAVVWTVLAVAVVGAAISVAAAMSRRRSVRLAATAAHLAPAGPDPRALEGRADEAEHAGDYATAVRLRFRAGLLRLGSGTALRSTESMTSRQVARRLRSPRFDLLAAAFDQIVYGGRAATASDAETARVEWAALLGDVRGKRAA